MAAYARQHSAYGIRIEGARAGELLRTTNAVADTMARARHYGQRAIDVLGSFAKGPARDALTETVEFAIARAY